MSVGIGRRNIIILFGNKEAAQFHFWEYINGNQTLDSHWPFIGSALQTALPQLRSGSFTFTTWKDL
jgi:hypothetical protein